MVKCFKKIITILMTNGEMLFKFKTFINFSRFSSLWKKSNSKETSIISKSNAKPIIQVLIHTGSPFPRLSVLPMKSSKGLGNFWLACGRHSILLFNLVTEDDESCGEKYIKATFIQHIRKVTWHMWFFYLLCVHEWLNIIIMFIFYTRK